MTLVADCSPNSADWYMKAKHKNDSNTQKIVTGQHVLTNKPNVVIILDVYAYVHFQIFLVSP